MTELAGLDATLGAWLIRSEIEVPGAALAAVRRTQAQLATLTEIVARHPA